MKGREDEKRKGNKKSEKIERWKNQRVRGYRKGKEKGEEKERKER